MADPNKLQHVHGALKRKFKDKKLIFGNGFTDAKIVFVSEIIGPNEEQDQKPLSGDAARVFNKLLKNSGIDKRRVYITNVVKYAPPKGVQLTPKEIKSHAMFLREELKTIAPQVVVTLGNLALNGVGMRQPIENVHGRSFNLGSYELLPTFHPSAALNDPHISTLLEADFAKLKDFLHHKPEQS